MPTGGDEYLRWSFYPKCGEPSCFCQSQPADPTPAPDQSFESRVIALAETLFDNKRNLTGYEWGDAVNDAIRILTTEEYL